jgi:oligopeptide transport system substrate-binding protein
MVVNKLIKGFALAAILALAAAACGGGGEEGTKIIGKAGGSATSELGEPDGLDPLLCATTSCAEPNQRLFDSLLNYDVKTLKLVKNAAATDYSVSADAKTLTFQLRKGATFHNGEPVTAESFVRGLTRVVLKDNASELSYHLDGIKGFADAQSGKSKTLPGVHQGKDDHELVIELDKANAEFITRTGHSVFSPVPKAADGADGKPSKGFNEAPIGNGPYKMVGTWQHNVQIKVDRFSAYNGPVKGFLDSITWKMFAEIDAAFLEFQGGTIDSTPVPPEQFDAAASQYGDAFVEQPTAVLTYMLANTTAAPTNNKKFRQALSMAINREEIIKAVFSNRRVPATTIIPPTTLGYRSGACKYCKFDVAEAKRLLGEAGGAPSTPIIQAFNAGAGHEGWNQAIQAQFKQNIGVNSVLTPKQPFGDYIKFLSTPAFLSKGGLGRLGWAQDYPTADNWLFPLLFSTSGDNHSKYNNPDFDKLVRDAQQTIDPAKRLKIYQQAEDIALEDMAIIPLWYGKSATVYASKKFATFPVDIQYSYPVWELVSIK